MPLKKPSEFYDKNPNSSLDEIRENVTPQKVEKISEAFDSFKSNFDHIQTLTEFTNTFDTFKNNIEKVDSLTESVSDINDSIQDLIKKEDLDDAMTAQLLFVEESIRSVQDKVKTLNSKSVFAIKEEFSSLSETVYNFIDEEVPSYHKLIVDSETRVDSRFLNFKEDITSKVEDVHKEINLNLSHITESIESINEENLSSVKEEVKGIRGKVESLLEKVLPKYKKFFAETEVRTEEKISAVEETAKEIEEKYESQIKEITENFDEFVNKEIPKYKKLLVDSKLKTEEEVKDISKNLDEQVSKINKNVVNLQQRVNNKDIEIDEVLLEKTNTIDKLINKSKDLSRIYDDLSRDFKEKEVQYENALGDFSKKINTMEESLTDNICELQENLDTSTSKYYSEMKNAVVPAVVNFEKNLSSQLKEMKIDFTVNEKHVDSLRKEFKDLVEQIRVTDDLQERNESLSKKIDKLEEVLEKFDEKTLTEGLLNIPPNVDNSDPLTPLDQKYATLEDLQSHYRLFINRIQQQISTLGGGGEVFLTRMEDVDVGAGIATDGFVLAWDKDLQLFTPSAGGSAGAGGTWGSNSVGVSTTRYVGINTSSAKEEFPLYVGPTGLAGTTIVAKFDGDISVAGTIFKENVKNVDSIGLVTARSGLDVGYAYEGGTGVGITMKPSGNAVFAGVVTAAHMFYPPVITTVQRDALTVNAGALIFNTTSTQLEIYNGTTWVGVGAVNNLTISNL
ncbi:MAG: hypothetical protein CBB96_07795 [Gammaproteobacteria bacterium TMED36]|nr:MAG: hypothetical protein CBB96_07795 [Gammaproteobacteria bacterium TMED36]